VDEHHGGGLPRDHALHGLARVDGRAVEGAFEDFDVVDEPAVHVQQDEREDLPFSGAELEEDEVVEPVGICEYGRARTKCARASSRA
jgi:hypothetical protein